MGLSGFAGLGGIAFVLAAIAINVAYVRARLPLPTSGLDLDAVTDAFAAVGDALKRPSVLAPATWLFTTVFAAGLLAELWRGGSGPGAWALVGFGGVLMQNVTFTCVEALRFGLASAARRDRGSVAGLWGLSNVLFGFNQVFLAIALLGFTVAGAGVGLIPGWHAVLGYVSAALLFLSSSASPHNADGAHRGAVLGLVGWLGWAAWIVACSITLLRL
ncbi:hypothetical protein ACQPZF_32145 [Actinosynnema sp. CS-041913]|uniref:hypothetical protein n=1 Tax=Actinosynnema sp. CS-041913 TaxID=3239917 RepID=UPI003D8D647A